MLSADGRGARPLLHPLWVHRKRANARPCSQHILVRYLLVKVPVRLLQYEVYLLYTGFRQHRALRFRVGCTADGGSLPGEKEEHTPVRCLGHDQAHVLWAKVVGQDDVHASSRDDDGLYIGVVHFSDIVNKGPCCIHYCSSVDGPGRAIDCVFHFHARHLSLPILLQALHFDVVAHCRSMLECGQHDVEVHPGVIVLAIVVHDCAAQPLLFQHWKLVEGLGLADVARGGHSFAPACYEIVQLHTGIDVRDLPPIVDGHHDGEGLGHVRCRVDHVLSLVQSFFHQLVEAVVHLFEGVFEVANATMNELCRSARRARTEVTLLD
mmetsp:Transcript_6168/g.15265  ORF Transcript_6168/g.15265 Transcript_6168/m.15265 type:complete len:322 (-) Transcript_6168:360-1325(-)